jgi:hypothetical protein
MSEPQDPFVLFLMLITIGPCVFNYISHFIYQSLHSFTQVATQNHATSIGRMLVICQLVRDCSWCLRDLRTCANLWQQTMDSWGQWSSWAKWMPWVLPLLGPLIFSSFCYWTLSFSNTFLLCFPKPPGFCPGHYPDQLNPVPPRSAIARRPCW